MPSEWSIARPYARRAPVRQPPFRGGRVHPFAIRPDVQAEQEAGINAKVLAEQQRSKRSKSQQ